MHDFRASRTRVVRASGKSFGVLKVESPLCAGAFVMGPGGLEPPTDGL
jgi:hypothetical protein